MKKTILVSLLLSQVSAWGQVDKGALQRYLGGSSTELYKKLIVWNSMPAGTRPVGPPTEANPLTLESLLPLRRPFPFPAYIRARSPALPSLVQQVTDGQMNKMLAGTAGGSGTTSLLSNSVAADVLSLATEYGAINQTVSGNTSTVRGNLAGVAGFFVGDPYLGCTSLAVGCSPGSRLARSFSSSISVATAANSTSKTIAGTNAATGAPATTGIFTNGNRMSAWNVRYDLLHKTLYDTTKYKEFAAAMAKVSTSPEEKELDTAIGALMQDVVHNIGQDTFVAALQNAAPGHLIEALQDQLDAVIRAMSSKDPQFMAKVQSAQNAIQATFLQRDAILRELQSNKFSVEFNSLHPLGQPNLSNVRLIFSFQPTDGPLLFTLNAASEWYDTVPTGVKVGRLRDVQAAAQLDRQLGTIPKLGTAVLTMAFYYQWMRSAALISIPAGNTAPGTGIVLPGPAGTLLAPKGSIDIGQVKLTLPIKSGVVKVPISFTWSNRTELIKESEKRGQIGLTLDLDSLFKK